MHKGARKLSRKRRAAVVTDEGRENEIISEIIDALGPFKVDDYDEWGNALRPFKLDDCEDWEDVARRYVSLHLKTVRTIIPLFEERFNRAAHKDSATKLSGALANLEKLLQCAPDGLVFRMFFLRNPNQDVIDLTEPKSRANALSDELNRIRTICEEEARHPTGDHPNVDHAAALCAQRAYYMVAGVDKEPTGGDNGPYRVIAGLLYEAATGIPDVDLRSHCLALLRHHRKLNNG